MQPRSRRAHAQACRRCSFQRSFPSHKIISPFREPAFPRGRSGATTIAELEPGNAVTATYARADMGAVDSTYAWIRLCVALVLGTIGSVGMWSYVVGLPPGQGDYGILGADSSLPDTLGIIGFACGRVAQHPRLAGCGGGRRAVGRFPGRCVWRVPGTGGTCAPAGRLFPCRL